MMTNGTLLSNLALLCSIPQTNRYGKSKKVLLINSKTTAISLSHLEHRLPTETMLQQKHPR